MIIAQIKTEMKIYETSSFRNHVNLHERRREKYSTSRNLYFLVYMNFFAGNEYNKYTKHNKQITSTLTLARCSHGKATSFSE